MSWVDVPLHRTNAAALHACAVACYCITMIIAIVITDHVIIDVHACYFISSYIAIQVDVEYYEHELYKGHGKPLNVANHNTVIAT